MHVFKILSRPDRQLVSRRGHEGQRRDERVLADELRELGAWAVEMHALSQAEREREPTLTHWSPWGERIDHIELTEVWKKAEPNHIMQWPSPWGMGYPGWHLECSVMGEKLLGFPFDIHTGGIDHRVTIIATGVPAICDHSGRATGRINGWPKLVPQGADGEPEAVADAITPATRAVIPVHLYGHSADMDGIALTEALMALPEAPVVIWMTAYHCSAHEVEMKRLGVCCCLDKPIEIGEIRRVVGEALDGIVQFPGIAARTQVEAASGERFDVDQRSFHDPVELVERAAEALAPLASTPS